MIRWVVRRRRFIYDSQRNIWFWKSSTNIYCQQSASRAF